MGRQKFFVLLIFLFSFYLFIANFPVKFELNELKIPLVSDALKITSIGFNPQSANVGILNFKTTRDLTYKLGLDLKGGTQLTYEVDMSEIASEDRENAFESVKGIIERRINLLGVSEPNIQTVRGADTYRLIVELPGVSDTESAVS